MLSPADLQTWLRSRHSVRRFQQKPVPKEVVYRILETAVRAPNAHNRQPWRFVVLGSPKSRENLASAMGAEFERVLVAEGLNNEEVKKQIQRSKSRLLEAPVAILLCLDTLVLDKYKDAKRTHGEYLMGVQSVALAGGQLLLAAHAEGLGAVWICAPLFAPAEVRVTLGLPESWQAQGVVLLGRAGKKAPEKDRLDVAQVRLVV